MPEPLPATASHPTSSNLHGMLWMALAGVIFVCFTGIVRHVSSDMDPLQAAFLRYIFGLVFLAPYFVGARAGQLRTRRLGLHAFRGLIHGIGVLLWFYAMSRIAIAEVTALGFTAPIFATIGAALFLGERMRLRRITAVVLGFIGAIVILRPGFNVIDAGAIAMLIAAPLFAVSKLITKALTWTESTVSIVTYLALIVTVVQFLPAVWVWQPPSWEEYAWLAFTAVLATAGHLCMVRALKAAEVTVTQPVEFLQLVWATVLGFYVFGENPDLWVWIGGAIIIGSATYIAHREATIRRRGEIA